ncbi:ribonuclease-3 family protein [Fontibacillus panacisegetis]|uniref:Mini-ribonuclease 3 n=1 Tax=Fontibacillus panacisegetis TaxID=670482 RepID=A0A1G7RR57_9BACL|nr:Mini-ribonuclease 3 [Fontibacillus panacisegetis]SDG13173.1 ribonuclease-3 family protein [Fontibacillus panacisegetis]
MMGPKSDELKPRGGGAAEENGLADDKVQGDIQTSWSAGAVPAPQPLWFPEAPSKPARLLPPLALAYIGDAIFEVAVRQHVMARPNLRPHHLHGQSTKYVSAKAQARLLALLEPRLTEDEKDIVRQGRNAKSGTVPKNADVLDYRHATAFESLIGYLYYKGTHERLRELIASGFEMLEEESSK